MLINIAVLIKKIALRDLKIGIFKKNIHKTDMQYMLL